MTKITAARFKKALPGSYGVRSVIAKKLDVTRAAITMFLKRNPACKKLCDTEREKIIDVAENRLFAAANAGEKWAVEKILKTIGKSRGFDEKQEVEITGTIPNSLTNEQLESEIQRLLKK